MTDKDQVEAVIWLSNGMIVVGIVTLIVCVLVGFQVGIAIAGTEAGFFLGGRTVAKYLSEG